MDGLKVFAGSSHPALTQEICKCLGIAPGAVTTTRFSNENLKVKIEENVREQDVFVVQTAAPPLSENIVELLILLDALRHASARRVTAVLPYFPYARDHGALSVSAAVVHPVLSGRAIERLAASRLEHLLVTNTIPLRHASAKVEVLSVAPLLAEAITRIHDGRSVSALFG